ncbi:Stf0 family sulfotransferase [Micromonospora sp. NPDC047620]|uniref:Stf0 family sulfotransferase n=1 Tax=Micromonospora sp. NPDC047620 TaxID=3364251 RepID=UPI003723078B
MPGDRVDSYFVCATPRTGSSLLLGLPWLRADQTGAWFVGGNGEISGDAGNGQVPRFDADGISHFLETIREHNAAWEEWFGRWGIRPHVVRYEELVGDMGATTHGILDFLGLDVPEEGHPVVARHQRQADELNRQWIRRYRAETADG